MDNSSTQSSLIHATKSRAQFSGHGKSLGAAGKRMSSFDPENAQTLQNPGQSVAITPTDVKFDHILIGASWDPIIAPSNNIVGRLLGIQTKQNIDIDIGCLYELQDGTRGAIQAFGEKWGALEQPPYIQLCGDQRTGDKDGYDETLQIEGDNWQHIKRALIYLYIYEGASNWAQINPKIRIDIPGEEDLVVTLSAYNDTLDLCAIGMIENVRGGLRLTNHTEYFPGHESMDRAFGFGLNWAEGEKE